MLQIISLFLGLFFLTLSIAIPSGCRSRPNEGGLDAAEAMGEQVEGHGTYFDGLGTPAGGCGVPQNLLETQSFLALNVQHTPNDYASQLARPIEDASIVGMWNNGRNCGRWVVAEVADLCVGGTNSGQAGTTFCQGGKYGPDKNNGAQQNMIVADSCQDGNTWCRDDRYHIDLSAASLSNFRKDGQVITGLGPEGWSNRKMKWRFIDAPNYEGDIKIYFLPNSEPFWAAVVITHLPKGIHGVESKVKGEWLKAKNVGDNGQAFVINGDGGSFAIRITDSYDRLLGDGRVYKFNTPCRGKCSDYTPLTYTTEAGANRNIPDPGSLPPMNEKPQTTTTKPVSPPQAKPPLSNDDAAPNTKPATPITGGDIQATLKPGSDYSGGYCVDLIVTNQGQATAATWRVTLDAKDATIGQVWNVKMSRSGSRYILSSQADWQAIAPGQSNDSAGFCALLPKGKAAATIISVQ